MVSVPVGWSQIAYGRERGLSVRRACTLLSVARSSLSYESRTAAKDTAVTARMREQVHYPRYHHRRIRIFLGQAARPVASTANLASIRVGDAAQIKLMGHGQILRGHVDSIARAISVSNAQPDGQVSPR